MNKTKKETAYYHLQGLFEFYELYRKFLALFMSTENIFMTGARSVLSMVHRQIACGEADVRALEKTMHRMFLL